ncbi:hypothetical protein CONCODRAFT_70724 [Conidiobolus coronatus NRRL 28638]|uniref:Galactose oxidase n=1 Tax=Conidiobolus coronatus (strain ATCC 28846 / CBS 209.66 / NRRL 28638) TaxID=796925 RepID=A0A137P5U4_CONC2|nr:hypothetical protein CONCODRAFT_70724 [Conidiobolus coronatus NRRL 28638]|eukprot:KXN70382.1 hypothetical protein CONCODRAFT_70724 [Conidiobolus coronatus NRRL 28638]
MLIIILLIKLISCQTDLYSSISTSTLINDKLIIYDPKDPTLNSAPSLTTYTIKDGSIQTLQNSTVRLAAINNSDYFQFLPLPKGYNGADNGSTDLWLTNSVSIDSLQASNSGVEDSSWIYKLSQPSSLSPSTNLPIPTPTFTNFPLGGYTQTLITTSSGQKLLILGGFLQTSNGTAIITNYLFQFDFSTSKWEDLSSLTNNMLPPIANHKALQLGDSLIVMFGKSPTLSSSATSFSPTISYLKANKTNDAKLMYKFNLINQSWQTVKINDNLNPNLYQRGSSMGQSISTYNNGLIIYTNMLNFNNNLWESYLGVFNNEFVKWEWFNIQNDQNFTGFRLDVFYADGMVIGDTLVIINGNTISGRVKQLMFVDLKQKKLANNLVLQSSSSSNLKLPVYAIVLITLALLAILVFCIWYYIKRKRTKKTIEANSDNLDPIWASNQESLHNSSKFDNNNNLEGTDTTLNSGNNMTNLPDYLRHEVDIDGISPISLDSNK